MPSHVAADLSAALGPLLGWEIRDLRRLTGGASRQTWSFDAVVDDGSVRGLILRRDPPGAPKASMGLEAQLLRAAAAAGVPVPEVITASDDPTILGSSFLVMERVDGETIPRKLLRDDQFAAAREVLVEQAGRALAAIHTIDPGSITGLEGGDQVEQFRALLDAFGHPHPAFELAFRWLESHRPSSSRVGVVHGDFRTGNLLVDGSGLQAVLDWELAHAGDPIEDLGWFCVRSWRFGSALPAGGFGTREALVAAYESAGGPPVDLDELRWWEVLGNLKWGIMCIVQAMTHLSGGVRSVELAAIGRRVCEVEWDLLSLLASAPEPFDEQSLRSSPVTPSDSIYGRPTAAELVEAVREFLESDVMTADDRRLSYNGRVAAKALAIVERELAAGASQADAQATRLTALGFSDEGALAAAIRSGSVDDRLDAVTDAVRQTVIDKLLVANPDYLTRP
jgi:aminoglycoside phosphotransferase (APT) family kinase protein